MLDGRRRWESSESSEREENDIIPSFACIQYTENDFEEVKWISVAECWS